MLSAYIEIKIFLRQQFTVLLRNEKKLPVYLLSQDESPSSFELSKALEVYTIDTIWRPKRNRPEVIWNLSQKYMGAQSERIATILVGAADV